MNLPKIFKFLFMAVFSVLAVSAWAQTGNRYALVIGNNSYKNGITALSTPVNDATDVSASLKTLGYETVLKTNTTIADLEEAIDQFLIKLDTNRESEGFFWFAGHGVNIANKHYLLAVDVDPRNDNSIKRGSYSVDELVERFDRVKNKANLLVIDACRNDFIPGSRAVSGRGLAVVASDSVVGNVIAYSTRAGQTADDGKPGDRNSPFCAAFLSNIATAKSFDNLFIQIANDTRTRTNGKQLPYKIGYFTVEDYTIAPVSKSAQPQTAATSAQPVTSPTQQPSVTGGSVTVESEIAGEIFIDGQGTGRRIKAGGTETISNVSTGNTEVAVKDSDGVIVKAPIVMVRQGQTVTVVIERPIPEGLAFEIVGGKSVTITKYTGTAATVHIPEKIQGLPVIAIGANAFYECKNLTNITIPSSVTAIGERAFTSSGLINITIPPSIKVIGEFTFAACDNLTSINIPSSVTSLGSNAVSGGENLTSITVDSRNSAFIGIDGVLFDKNIKSLVQYPRGKKGAYSIPSSVTNIEVEAFFYCKSLTSVTIPSSVTTIRSYTFYNCSNLTSVTIPSSVTSIGDDAFSGCTKLTSMSIPSSVTSIGEYAFSSCGMTSISIPSSVKTIGEGAFSYSKLTNVTLSRKTKVGEKAFPESARITYID
ncbi:hypothetical protein R84B8_02231 [Treponema sp. R8-4-B8]